MDAWRRPQRALRARTRALWACGFSQQWQNRRERLYRPLYPLVGRAARGEVGEAKPAAC
jgi:hypothetical protein